MTGDALSVLLESEARRQVSALVDALFVYDERRDCYRLRYPDVTEYSREALKRMAKP